MKKLSRILSLLVVLALVLSLAPMTFAADTRAAGTYELTDALSDGDQVIIYCPAAGMAMSEEDTYGYRAGEAVTPSAGTITTSNSLIVWDVEAVSDGYIFRNDAGESLSCTSKLGFADTDNVWEVSAAATAGCVYLTSTTKTGEQGDPKLLEWYDYYSEFSTFYYFDDMEADFAMELYVLSGDAPVNPDEPVDPDTPADPAEGSTVTFVTPASSWTETAEDGYVTAPACEEAYEGYIFECWVTETYEKTDGSDIYEFYYEGEEIEVTGSVTLYALYCYYEIEIGGECYYWAMVEDDDFSGQWALVGFNYDIDIDDYDVESPVALGSDAGEVDVVNDLGASVDAENFEFFTDDDSIRFEFILQTNGTYLIRNVKTGQYLTAPTSEGYASMSASPSAYSYWYVGYDELYGCEQVVSAADENLMLYYDDEYCEFYVFDNTVEIFDGCVASDYYYIYFYAYTSGETEVPYYTTEIDTELPDDPDQPDDPDDPIVPDCQHENTELRGAKEATCTEDGYTGDVYCTDCGEKLYSGTVIKATGHDYEDGVCTVCGEEDPNASEDPEDPDVTTGDCYFDDFSDCKDEWYHEAVDYTVANELMKGVGEGLFDPSGTMTRAMIVTVLYRAAGEPEVAEPCTFTDVAADQWYSDAIAWAEDNGVVNGVGEGKFAPMANVTREQIATILWRYSGSPEVEASLDAFADGTSVSAYAQDAILWAVAEGIMQGDGKNLTPTANATRAQFACMIMRYLGGSYNCAE